MLTSVTQTLIEDLIAATCAQLPDARCRHLMTHALHALVRAARAEQLQQLRRDVANASGAGSSGSDQFSATAGCGNGATGRT